MEIHSGFALLDVLGDEETLRLSDALAADDVIKVVITGTLHRKSTYGTDVEFKPWSQFDGTSQEFALDVESVEVLE